MLIKVHICLQFVESWSPQNLLVGLEPESSVPETVLLQLGKKIQLASLQNMRLHSIHYFTTLRSILEQWTILVHSPDIILLKRISIFWCTKDPYYLLLIKRAKRKRDFFGATLFFRKPNFQMPKFWPSVVQILTKHQNFEKSNVQLTKCSTNQIFDVLFVQNDKISNFIMLNISIDFCTRPNLT
jgi:hypothetical protein